MNEHPPKPEHLLANREYILWRMAKLAVIRKQADWEWETLVERRMIIDEELKDL